MILHALDLIGVFAFASYGATRALQAQMNLFGVFVCAALVAVGGGTVRELLLGGTPSYLLDYWYIAVVTIAGAFAILLRRSFHKLVAPLAAFDAVGLGAFALLGASRAANEGFGLGGIMLCGTLTAVGGGVICDLLTGRSSRLFYDDFCIVPALLTCVAAWMLQAHLTDPPVVIALVTASSGLQLAALRRRWTLWRPGKAQQPPALAAVATHRHPRAELTPGTEAHWDSVTLPLPTVRNHTEEWR